MDIIRETADKYQPLFNLMSEEHGLTLTMSEMDDIIAKVDEVKQLFIPVVRVRFFLKLKRRDNTHNGNGYGIWNLDWAWFRKRGSKRLWTQKLGNGDNGERCMG